MGVTYRTVVLVISLVALIGISFLVFLGWRFSSHDGEAYIIIVDHDINDQMLSCGRPEITQAADGTYFVHAHSFYGDTFKSGKVVTVSNNVASDDEKKLCKEGRLISH